jgi:cytochrome c-type biogenesis protein CcmH
MLDFWALAAAIAGLTAFLLIRPLVTARRAGESRASHDVAVFRDQLTAVDRDLDRGVLSGAEAEGARAEVSRRLLAAAAEAERSHGAGPAPAGVSRIVAIGMTGLLAVAGGGLYLHLGAPGAADLPLGPRIEDMRRAAAERPPQLEAERRIAGTAAPETPPSDPNSIEMREMVERLRQVLAERPDDLRGRRLLVQALMRMDDVAGAWRAQEDVIALLADDVSADDHALAAEAMILAARGYVSPQAERRLTQAIDINPLHTTARYYAGLSLAQNGRPDLTLEMWTPLLTEGPADAPWKEPILTMIGGVAAEAGKPVPPEAAAAADALRAARAAPGPSPAGPGPDAEDMRAAEDMTPEDRAAMIEGMVAQLENKLATTGGVPADWARLIQTYGVLGRSGDVARVMGSARTAFASAPGVVAQLEGVAARAAPAKLDPAKLAPTMPAPTMPGPDAAAVRDAQTMAPEDRAAMISGMVARLAERLQTEGGTPEEWARLIRAYGVTGDQDAAAAAMDAALQAHGDDPAARAMIEAAGATQ